MPDPALELARRPSLTGLRVLAIGLGQFGGQIAVIRYLAERGATVRVTDRLAAAQLARGALAIEALAAKGLCVELRLGRDDIGDLDGVDLVVPSPAVPDRAPVLREARARGIPITSEIALTLAELGRRAARVVGVTGSNGKTTTATLLAAALRAAGATVHLGGNIGHSLLGDLDRIEAGHIAALELSSFQLDRLRAYPAGAPGWPEVGVVTNLSPNHLDRHGCLARYQDAKAVLARKLPRSGTLILPAEAGALEALAELTAAGVGRFAGAMRRPGEAVSCEGGGSLPAPAAWAEDGAIWCRQGGGRAERLGASALTLPGPKSVENACAALAVCAALGLASSAPLRAVQAATGLPHRLEDLGAVRGVRFVNDSKATTTAAAQAGISAYAPRVIWLGGGSDKGVPFDDLAPALRGTDGAIVYGAVRGRLRKALRGKTGLTPLLVEPNLESAFRAAVLRAKPGSTILLSPACASYDAFSSYEQRGARFRELVAGHRRARGGAHARRSRTPIA